MKYLKILYRFFLVVLVIVCFSISCKDKYDYIDYVKLEKEELALRDSFYSKTINKGESIPFISLLGDTIFRSILSEVTYTDSVSNIDTLDMRKSIGFFMAKIFKSGRTDSIKVGQTIGFRYIFWYLDKDENDDLICYPLFTNTYSFEPDYYSAGNYTTTSATMCYGLDLGIRNMRFLDRSLMIIPSSIGAQSLLSGYSARDRYKTIIAEIEITYFPDN